MAQTHRQQRTKRGLQTGREIMQNSAIHIGVVAPATRLTADVAADVTALAAADFPAVTLHIHPQCFLSHHHFAGTDEARLNALTEMANDPTIDAIWFARGGYGSNRIAQAAVARMGDAARNKLFMGYSDNGFLLAALYKAGFQAVHGPMPADILRTGGAEAVRRALAYLSGTTDGLEPQVIQAGKPLVAFNLTILTSLLGTALEPDLCDHVLMIEDVSEYMYRIDRMMFQLASCPGAGHLAGIRLGRISDVPDNDPDFGEDAETVVRHWCACAAIPFLGAADIGHDAKNKIVPFGFYSQK